MVSFLDVTGIKPCPDLSPNQNALRIASGTEPTPSVTRPPLTVVQFLCSLHHCKRWRWWSTFNGRQRSGRMIYRPSLAVVVLGRPPPTFLTAVPVVWNAYQARETTLSLIPYSAATLVTVRPSSSFPIILSRVKSSRFNRYQSRQHPSPFLRFSLELNTRLKPLGLYPQSIIGISVLVLLALWLTVLKAGSNSFSPLSRSGLLKTMKFSEGSKSFEMCTSSSCDSASPAHILECLGLTKQDLADDPLLFWIF
ncbi:structural maintenance of chromosomes protein 2-2 [Trichonephila clavipes]|nr:structural maintenance of chromosomes protein 2-2 [Trichonephila clavipes]